MTPALTATPLDARIDQIAKRQTARFLDRQRQAGELTPRLQSDFLRMIRFTLDDVKQAIRENAKEAHSDPAQN